MNPTWKHAAFVLLLGLVAGCSQPNSADPETPPAGTTDTDRFWIFPNPDKDPATGVYTTNDASYAQAYYDAIDPLGERATLAGFKTKNGFGTTVAGVNEINVIFRDVRDLGYGRKMTVRFTDPGAPGYVAANHTVAVFVENYQVVPFAGADYSSLNLEAAVTGNTNYHVGTNAIEYSTAPNGLKFAKFYSYAQGSGVRVNSVNLDGRGQKAMPSVCINCHGGRADPLFTNRASVPAGVTTFPNGGYTKARLQPIDVGSVEFWSTAPYRRIDQEEALRQINYAIFCAHSIPAAGSGVDACRPVPPQGHDYQGAAAEMMKAWYNGSGGIDTPSATHSDSYVPTGWADNTVATRLVNPVSLVEQQSLYDNIVKPYCRVCHQLRGTENVPQDDIDFTSYLKFEGYADRIKHHVFDRGNMPLGLIIYNTFWEGSAPEQLADWLTSVNASYNPARVGGGATGRPVQPSGLLTDPTFLASTASTTPNYNTGAPNAPFPFTKPTTFANIKAIIQNTNTVGCTGCHFDGAGGVGDSYAPPIAYTDYDRDGDSGVDADDDYEFYKALRGRVNLTDFLASPLLRKPTGNHHGGGNILDPTLTATPTYTCQSGVWPDCLPFATLGDYNQAAYDTFLDWIEHGAPYSYTGSTPNY